LGRRLGVSSLVCLILAPFLCVFLTSCQRQPLAVTPIKMVAGGSYTVALTASGDVYSWGTDHCGNLGRGITDHSEGPQSYPDPARVRLPAPATDVFAGSVTAFAILADGAVYGWGTNTHGELGDGTTTDRATPVRVLLDRPVTQIAAGVHVTMAITQSGLLYTWGSNEYGTVGDGSTKDRLIPALLDVGELVQKAAAVGRHCLVLTRSGRVLAWGRNNDRQVGELDTPSDTPVPVPLPGRATDIAAGLGCSLALIEGGEVLAWGSNIYGVLGNGKSEGSSSPVTVLLPGDIVAIASGWSHVFALSATGMLYGWGWNKFGQVGIGFTSEEVLIPTRINLDPFPPTSIISVGDAHAFLTCPDGTIYGWGGNTIGQLGDGTRTRRFSPVRLPSLIIK